MSYLACLRRYVSFSHGAQSYLTSVHIEDGRAAEIPASHVLYIAAAGNYLRVYAGIDLHELSDTISGTASRLDPAQFVRVYRSYIVNRTHRITMSRKGSAAVSVLLGNGTDLPVGPNFRSEVDSFDSLNRLSA